MNGNDFRFIGSSLRQWNNEPNTENFRMPSVGGQILQYHSIIVVSSLSIVSFVTWCGENDSSANFEIWNFEYFSSTHFFGNRADSLSKLFLLRQWTSPSAHTGTLFSVPWWKTISIRYQQHDDDDSPIGLASFQDEQKQQSSLEASSIHVTR